jgi:adenine-specific DNA-methyltransferase
MTRGPKPTKVEKKPIEQYEHKNKKRLNNPPVGLVTPETDKEEPRKTYSYDPHLDPQLVWTGKHERISFDVPSVSLHVHERIDPRTIIEAVKRKNGRPQMSLFQDPNENPPLREAIEFYKHKHNWSNRMIAGDSLLVMNSLLEKEGMAGQVQMAYFDPPYGIRYGSNFQPFVNKRDVKDGKDEDLTAEPEMIKAFRDTWELGIHSYLTYLRDRLLLVKQLLNETGSVFVQISDENVHYVRQLLDEIFGPKNFQAQINFKSTSPLGQQGLAQCYDYILWYAVDGERLKFRALFKPREILDDKEWRFIDDPTEELGYRKLTEEEFRALPSYEGVFRRSKLTSSGFTPTCIYEFQLNGQTCRPFGGKSWVTTREGVQKLIEKKRLFLLGDSPYFKQYYSDFPVLKYDNSWSDQPAAEARLYVVQTAEKFIQRCMLMTSDPGDLIVDITCGSGTSAVVAERWGRRWITCDTSRVALALAKQRLMTEVFQYYQLLHPEEGISGGLLYKVVPHVTVKSLANDEPTTGETLYDQPLPDSSKVRVSGPFTVEAVPAPVVRSLEEVNAITEPMSVDSSVARSGATVRDRDWRDELLRSGIRGRASQRIDFTRVEPLPATRWLHADAETKEESAQRAVVSFGPEHAPMEQRQVELAIEEAGKLVPKPKMIVFAAFQFDPEAAKDIDELNWPGVTLLKAQMNADLLTEDLKKKRASNESFWLVGQPDVEVLRINEGEDKDKFQIAVNGFDYYNTKNGKIESGGNERIAMWMLDTDYDGRSLFPRQVFFPMAGEGEGWAKLAKNLKAEIDPDLSEAYRGVRSLPFAATRSKQRAAVKIIDDRGIESLRILDLE